MALTVMLEVVGVVLSVALVVLVVVVTLLEVEAHNLLGEVTTQRMLSPDRN